MSADGTASVDRRTARAEAVAWFARLRSDDVTDGDRHAFEQWLRSAPARAEAYRKVDALWSSAPFAEAAAAHAPALARQRRRGSAGRPKLQRLAAAAALAAVIGLGAIQFGLPIPSAADLATAAGERTHVALEDGSVLYLNTASAVDVAFQPDRRKLTLERGEAYVEVAPDADRPLAVRAGAVVAEALGTAFSVRRADETVVVAVRHGSVRVAYAGRDAAVLRAGQAVTVAEDGGVREFAADDATFAWTAGRLVFTERPFGEVIDELRRYHRGIIVLLRDDLGTIPISGSYRLDDTATTVAALAAVVGADVTRVTDRILIIR